MAQFKTPEACARSRDSSTWKKPYGSTSKANGETRQVQCAECKRWCYVADRCNLFVGLPQRASSRRGPSP